MQSNTPIALENSLPVERTMAGVVTPAPIWKKQSLAMWLLLAAIALAVLEGAARKWLLRGGGGSAKYLLYFSKDICLAALIFFCPPRSRPDLRARLTSYLIPGFTLLAVGTMVSLTKGFSLVGGILSLRSLVLLPLACIFLISRLRTLSLPLIAMVVASFTLINAAVATIQHSSAPDDPINYYATDTDMGSSGFEESVRSAGTFAYITGLSLMGMIGAWAGLVLISYASRRKTYLLMGIVTYFAGLWCALMTISRGATLIILLMAVLWFISDPKMRRNVAQAAIILVACGLVGAGLGLNERFSEATSELVRRHEMSTDTVEERVLDPITQIADAVKIAPGGNGFGTEQVGGVYADYGVMSLRTFEYQFPRLVLETGVLGLIGFLIICYGTLRCLFVAAKRTHDDALRSSILVTILLVGSLFFLNVVFNHVASFFAWVFGGLLLGIASTQSRDLR